MPSSQIPYKPLIHPDWQLPTQLFTLIDIILAYNPDSEAPWSPTEVTTSPSPIDKPMPVPIHMPMPTPVGFIIDFTKDSLIGSLYSKYLLLALEISRESLFKDSAVKYINLRTEDEEITIPLSNYSIPKPSLPTSPFTEWVYTGLIIEDLEAITYF